MKSPRNNPVRTLGFFSSVVFFLGAVLIFALNLFRGLGVAESITFNVISQLIASFLFWISSRSTRLYFIQPVIFLALAPLNLLSSRDSFYGLGFFMMAVILLFKIGFFARRRTLKLIGLIIYLYGWELYASLRAGWEKGHSLTPVFFVTAFLLFLYILYREQIIVYLKEPKPVLDLRERGLSETERAYIVSLDRGMSPKEIAADHKVSDSTVRNTLARAYKKLGVKDKSELTALVARHTVKGD